MTEQDPKHNEALEGLDQSKRETLTRLITGSAFVAPVVVSFAMQGISIRPAHAQVGSSSNATNISDLRLKKNVTRIGTHASGCGIYRFNYLWSDAVYTGAIAQDVLDHAPEVVTVGPGNFLAVDYGALGMTMTREDARAA
jgi:hypothetical protein